MINKTVYVIFAFGFILAFGVILFKMKSIEENTPLRIAYPYGWKTIVPPLQHTLYGDLLLSNQFDSLVGYNQNGVIVPNGAVSWKISEDYTIYEFKIDTSKKFSDGSSLRAIDYKRSWEKSLNLNPISKNKSVLDVLYKLIGYENFESSGSIPGIELQGDSKLILKFSTPFRQALSELAGVRYSAFKIIEGKYIGTGRYVITEKAGDKALLTPQLYHTDARNLIEIEAGVIDSSKSIEALKKGEIDILPYSKAFKGIEYIENETDLGIVYGQHSQHSVAIVNGIKGRLFSNKKLRLAVQYLMIHSLQKESLLEVLKDHGLRLDSQIYLPLQAGRISDEEVSEIISEGEKYVEELILASEKHPLICIASETFLPIINNLRIHGVKIADLKPEDLKRDFFEMVYKSHYPDILIGSFSVSNGDPDGIYHALGKNGAIMSPMIFRKNIAELLEEGRAIFNKSKLHQFYQQVSRSVLENVPFVHLGFLSAIAFYRKDKIIIDEKVKKRNDGHLHFYRRK